jgi:hypothetical protein
MNMENENEKKNASDYIDSDLSGLIDDIKNEIPDGEEKQEETQSIKKKILTPKKVAKSIQPVSRMMSRKFELASIELTDEDANDLAEALEPFEENLDKILKIIPYIPLILFAIGYSARIWEERSKKKKLKKKNVIKKPKVKK